MDSKPEFTKEVKSNTSQTMRMQLDAEAALVRQASQGDSIALTKIYELYIDDIYSFCYSRVGNISEAENLTSETFTRALEALSHGHFTWQGKPLGAWLYGIAANVVREYMRKSMNAPIIEELDHLLAHNEPESEQPDMLETLIQKEKQDAIWQLIKELTVEEQRILVLRHGYELSYAEIAERLGRGENACKQFHYRVLKKLKLKAQEVDLWTEVPKDEH
jgi:RNA polymerase sigma-70 factor, ECF subfamily